MHDIVKTKQVYMSILTVQSYHTTYVGTNENYP